MMTTIIVTGIISVLAGLVLLWEVASIEAVCAVIFLVIGVFMLDKRNRLKELFEGRDSE